MNEHVIDALHKEIEKLVVPDAGTSFSGEDFRNLCKPCVYIFLKAGVPIYIGVSRRGIGRAAQHENHRNECDEVRIFPCRSEGDALKLESALIYGLRPKHNRIGFGSHVARFLGICRLCSPPTQRTSDN